MGLFRRRVDPRTATRAAVDAFAREDQAAIAEALAPLRRLTPPQVFEALRELGEEVSRHLTHQLSGAVAAELASADAHEEIVVAVEDIGAAALLRADRVAMNQAIAQHAVVFALAGGGHWSSVVYELVAATGRICRRLNITIN